ncbi:MAG: nuclear transport factor 2 family protein [Actinomycetota bacterium]
MRKAYDAFNAGDLDALGELFADDIVFHSPGTSAISGDFRGKDAVFGHFGQVDELTGNTLRAELHDVLANDEHVVALHTDRGEREGKGSYDNKAGVVAHIRDGKIAEVWSHVLDSKAEEEFFA